MQGAGYLTTNAGVAWPFDEDDPAIDTACASMFADGEVVFGAREDVVSVYVSDVDVSDGSLSFKVVKTNRDGTSSDVTRIEAEPDFDLPYYVVRGGWCSFVLDTHSIALNAGMHFNGPFRLSPTAVSIRADHVTSISIYNSHNGEKPTLDYAGIDGNVRLVAGTNAYVGDDLAQASYGALNLNLSGEGESDIADGVVFSAIAGAGAGYVPCDVDCDKTLSNSGNVIPDETGSVVIEGDDCYQVSPDGVVKITGRCTACCQCDSFVEIGDKLAAYSRTVKDIYDRSKTSAYSYNASAATFNQSLSVVSKEELVARASVVAQFVENGPTKALHLERGSGRIHGSVDRAQGVISIKNTSVADVNVSITAKMSPQSIILASIIVPNSTAIDYTGTMNTTIRCSGNFRKSMKLPSGSGTTIRLYGSSGAGAKSPSSKSSLSAVVKFDWTETNPVTGEVVNRSFTRTLRAYTSTIRGMPWRNYPDESNDHSNDNSNDSNDLAVDMYSLAANDYFGIFS